MDIYGLLKQYQNRHVILIDMSWVLYRSYYAFRDLSNAQGEPTGQWYGLSSQIKQIVTINPDSLVLLVDDGKPVERKELNESYKGNRSNQVHFSDKRHITDCLIQLLPNVFRVYNPVVEADDLMFTISRITDYNNTYTIYTSDKDLYQSINETTKVASEIKNGILVEIDTDSEKYIKHFQDLEPYQLPFYRAVLGDPSDNLSIIRPRFPSKIAYYFAKNYIRLNNDDVCISKPSTKPDDLTQKQYENLLEIYSNENFMTNLKIMRLFPINSVPIVEKNKQGIEVQEVLNELQLKQYTTWLQMYAGDVL